MPSKKSTKEQKSELVEIAVKMVSDPVRPLKIKTRKRKGKRFKNSFLGKDFVDWFVFKKAISRDKATGIGVKMARHNVLHHVKDKHKFQDSGKLYRFRFHEQKNVVGQVSAVSSRSPVLDALESDEMRREFLMSMVIIMTTCET
eukprot:27226_1